MAKTTPELAPPTPNFHATPERGRLTHVRFKVHQAHKHDESSVESGLEPRPSDSKVKTLPQGHRALLASERGISFMKLNTILNIFESEIVQRQRS
ncbi:hypothetical protein AVEN_244058-1 [Araneus ventricosus]|uniref:Uncharacterized protein n=1 Tax=Araneus ventricosus TaxID=182803 RepID=A0A4Y2IHR4_ARAVE|nr:hypothetical protein AVEN_244058-1 [Araneus ventricosus]